MASRDAAFVEITPEVLLKAYSCGIFPMAESAEDPALYWIEPEQRGVVPLDRFHVSGRLARTVRSERFTVVCNRDFEAVIDGCAEPQPGRSRTWINRRIRNLYRGLYGIGHCHTIEVYDGAELVGGLYGVSLGRTFFGESMFHRARDASKVALVHLVARLLRALRAGLPRRRLNVLDRGGRCAAFAVLQPHIVDRVLDAVQARARGEHPAGEDALHLALQRDLLDLDEGVGVRRLGRRT